MVVCRETSQCIVNSGSLIAVMGENGFEAILVVDGSRSMNDRALRAQYV